MLYRLKRQAEEVLAFSRGESATEVAQNTIQKVLGLIRGRSGVHQWRFDQWSYVRI